MDCHFLLLLQSQKVSGQNYSASNNNMLVKCSMKDVAPASAIQPQGPHPLRPVHVNLQFTPGDFAQLHKEGKGNIVLGI